jgi:DNA-binding beta-propeller fold protein YncE
LTGIAASEPFKAIKIQKEGSIMKYLTNILTGVLVAAMVSGAHAQDNPYREDGWAKLPDGRRLGQTSGIGIDRDGDIWIFERCGANSCLGSSVPPIIKLDRSGKYVISFGAGMFVFPHGLHVDRDGNVWVTDADGKEGKGHQVIKFSPDGKVLLALGKAGIAGAGPDTFNRPSAVTTAPNGDILVADGHGGESNARVVRFSKDGKFIIAWGKKGTAIGEFDVPHAIATDSTGRVFVGDRSNNRVQVFDQNGNFLLEWKQFGRPSGLFIDHNDTIYVADSQSDEKGNPGFKRGIRIGSVKDGVVKAVIPGLGADKQNQSVGEGVVADAMGNVYWSETSGMTVRKFIK